MKAMILAAGRGTRLRPYTNRTPKPLLEVRGRPLIEHQLSWLKKAGITDIVINLHHLGEQITTHLGDGRAHGVNIVYSREEKLLETGGGIKAALPSLGVKPFVILNGDIFTTFDFDSLPEAPPDDCPAHIVVTPRPAFRSRGDFDVEDTRIIARGDEVVYCGIALLHPVLFERSPQGAFSLRTLYFEAMERGVLSAQLFSGLWTDIGTPDQLTAL
ncbi:MAG: nucleotidyltransferase family protein [Pseudomonadales bacterium]|nr:nucleotidyltransferase family protein [Pseudomonadales bacterium]MDP6470775.1 nucleotidyltransferase family protein [Pseudomonadales bacterium]MDP6828273.1 nucleotidyltransferase family protein [Pseudomonadales bacterium]MDP6973017.1 nucleotidyltransferase family protein [Pseudomonadales bacterium]